MGDSAGAVEGLDQATRMEPLQVGDAIWISRAAMRLGDWDFAEAVLNTWIKGSQDAEAQMELVSLKIMLAEAFWLYRAYGASDADPPEIVKTTETYRSIQRMLGKLSDGGTSEALR